MRRIPAAVMLSLIIFGVILGLIFCQPPSSFANPVQSRSAARKKPKGVSVEQLIRQVEHDWLTALTRPNLPALDEILADDFTVTRANGEVLTKQQYMSGILSFKSIVQDDVQVRVYRNAAVVTGRYLVNGQFQGTDLSGYYRFTNTYVKDQGNWRVVAQQVTRMTQQPPQP